MQSGVKHLRPSGWYENAFAGLLLVEEMICLVCLFQRPSVREELVDVDFPIGNEASAISLAVLRKCPVAED